MCLKYSPQISTVMNLKPTRLESTSGANKIKLITVKIFCLT